MKNRYKDAVFGCKRCTIDKKYLSIVIILTGTKHKKALFCRAFSQFNLYYPYFTWYITSFTSFTVRGTSGKAAATRLGA